MLKRKPMTDEHKKALLEGRKRPSLRKAINAFCRWCIYDPQAGGQAAAQVRACPSKDCPLYPVRPGARGFGSSAAGVKEKK